jgi:hypothetical protein
MCRFQAARIGTQLERHPGETLQMQIAEFELRAMRSPIGPLFPDKKWRLSGIPAARTAYAFCFQYSENGTSGIVQNLGFAPY